MKYLSTSNKKEIVDRNAFLFYITPFITYLM